MSRTHKRLPLTMLTLSAAIAAGAAPARAAGPQYDLQLRVTADQQWSFEGSNSFSMQLNSGGQQVQQQTDGKRTGTATILAAADNAVTAMRVTFGPDCGQTMTQNGQTQPAPFALAGKTVVIKKDALGIVQIDGAATDPATTNDLESMLTPDRSVYPTHPVAVGDEWSGDGAALVKQMHWDAADPMTVKCTLAKIGSVGGRPTADIAVTVDGSHVQNGVTAKMTLTGTLHADLATGQPLQEDMTGTITLAGQANGPQGPTAVNGDGKLEVHQSERPLAGVPAYAAPVPTPTVPAPTVATNEANPLNKPAADAVNPLAAAAPADQFAGTFKGDRLTLQLDPPADGRYAGTIHLGGQAFTAAATVDGDTLTGTFKSGENAFPFTATLAGTTLQFTSGKNQFKLERAAAANPLDAAGGAAAPAVNPLGN